VKALDFFCGGGGLTRGLLDAGIRVVAGFDHDERCRATYEHNNPGARFITKDINSITVSELTCLARAESFDKMLFAGCAPCQPFSKHRKGKTGVRDAALLDEFGRIVAEAKPGLVLIENVPGMALVPEGGAFHRFIEMLERNGYDYAEAVLDAKHYGVPQNRRRLVLIGAKDASASLPKPKYGPSLRPFKTVRQAIVHFPAIAAGGSHPDVPNHRAAAITPLNIDRLKHTQHDGGDRRSWPEHLRLACHKKDHAGHTDVYGRMAWDSPAPALTGRCNSISNGRYGHPEQDRAISLREAAALQSFPDGYIFFGSNNHIALQIGNAVPVRLAEELGKHIRRLRNGGDLSGVRGERH
jgi:DNA (cytosine-5)-methyltransferase 1